MLELVNTRLHEMGTAGTAHSYWILFIIPAFFAFFGEKRITKNNAPYTLKFDGLWWLFFTIVTIFLGFRVQVGGDWGSYKRYYELINSAPLSENFSIMDDPSYLILNWFSGYFGLGILAVNFISAAIFTLGLFIFCRSLPRPFLALTAAIPYMVIVVAAGYTRQAIALGLIMIGLVAISRERNFLFYALVILAATFHKTALIMLAISGLVTSKNKFLSLSILVITFYLAYSTFLSDGYKDLIQYYYQESYESSGAFIRILMLTLPSVLFLFFVERFKFSSTLKSLWLWSSIASLALLALLFIIDASTAIDRIGLYLLPIQLIVFAYLPDIFSKRGDNNKIIILLIIFYYLLVLYVWLYFSTHSYLWRPYRNALFEMI